MMIIKNSANIILKYFAIISAVAVLFSYAFLTIYYSAYLREFGVDIQSIDFWPSLYDLTLRAFAASIAILVVVIVFLAAIWMMRFFGRKLIKTKLKVLQFIGEAISYNIPTTLVVLGCVYLVHSMVFGAAEHQGVEDARNKNIYTVIVSSNDEFQDVLVYQNQSQAVVKKFNEEAHRFEEGYRIVDLTDKKYSLREIK